MFDFDDYDDDFRVRPEDVLDDDELAQHCGHRDRKVYRCADGFCGATDCPRCYPAGEPGVDEEWS